MTTDQQHLADLHEQIAQLCEYLGMDRTKDVCDSWGLRDALVRLKAEGVADG